MKNKCIYKYHDQYTGEEPLCIYLCNLTNPERALIVPLVPASINPSCLKLSVTRQFANVANFQNVRHEDIDPSFIFIDNKPAQISNEDMLNIAIMLTTIQEEKFLEVIGASMKLASQNSHIIEHTINYLAWKKEKYLISTEEYRNKTTIYENGIYWANLGYNIGTELNKQRPVLVWKKRVNTTNSEYNSYIVIPITSQYKQSHYKTNVPIQLNQKDSLLRIEDMQRISIKRITRPLLDESKKIVFIDNAKREEIKEAIRDFYIFDNNYSDHHA